MKAIKITAAIIIKCIELAIILMAIVFLIGEPANGGSITWSFIMLKLASFPMFWAVYKIDAAVQKLWDINSYLLSKFK